ncbi:DUF4123 domain-containing protein [Entomomonas moraniae]|uniref:DUF4123 domain-containing protein n=1 Tax=Entomomonas moraniae TaxID=2213226 RepID=A0A3Q9JJW6_9GAMM|nr:DUF4123 domain-containing protein [Entomomonas moraniae]AZS51302.1 DUF4123 domain-containing protein [Entomomonas moraniae]
MMDIVNWISKQQKNNRQCYLILDSTAEPNPIKTWFSQKPTQIDTIACLYKNTELASLEEVSPWFILLDKTQQAQIKPFVEHPEQNWGYFVCMDNQYSLQDLVSHWHDRMIIEEEPRALYRFQDNRIIIRHLSQLTEQQIPLLLGPINSVMAWNDEQKQWQEFINNDPKLRPNPIERPWLTIPEPESIDKEMRQKNTMRWLLNNYSNSVYASNIYPLYEWVEESLNQTDQWQWPTKEQQRLYILQRLDKEQRDDQRWQPLPDETPQAHYERCKAVFNKDFEYNELSIDASKL